MASSQRFEQEHEGLGKYRSVTGQIDDEALLKAEVFRDTRQQAWAKQSARERGILQANQETAAAQAELQACRQLLKHNLRGSFAFDWSVGFNKPRPKRQPDLPKPPKPYQPSYPQEPRITDPEYQTKPDLTVLFALLIGRRAFASERMQAKRMEAEARFVDAHNRWKDNFARIRREYEEAVAEWEKTVQEVVATNAMRAQEFKTALSTWETERVIHSENQKQLFAQGDHMVVRAVCSALLQENLWLPAWCPREFDADYRPETHTLLVEVLLPAPTALPKVKEVKYLSGKDAFREVYCSEKERKALYDDLVHQIVLSIIHALYTADTEGLFQLIVLNGWVEAPDPRTGRTIRSCIISVPVSREDFSTLILENVDPKACVRGLKGVSASSLYNTVPIAPIMSINREDSRFIAPRQVIAQIQSGQNLATMDWEDFEHLIREVFHQEFALRGGEVKITQASRDRGVDAIAFDPDPISGGKIVIQAKRYTITVPVAAVRDLYGTVINEGATKGILVTTSDYGPDAYEFAKGKPLTLLNGNNLLHLLEKHGHKARIDLVEARKLRAESGQGKMTDHY